MDHGSVTGWVPLDGSCDLREPFWRPVACLMFVVAVVALSGTAKVLGNKHELGFPSGRLASMLARYPEVTRPGVQVAWLTWAVLFGVALSPIDPIASS
jgi:hypothetical protein